MFAVPRTNPHNNHGNPPIFVVRDVCFVRWRFIARCDPVLWKVTDLYATIEDRIEDRTSGPIDPNRAINIEHFIEEPQR